MNLNLAQIIPYEKGPAYRSKTEKLWAQIYKLILMDELGMQPTETFYEPLKFSLPAGWYTPDFLHLLPNRTMLFVEIKGNRKQKGYARGRAAFKNAAEIYPFFLWAMAVKDGADNFEFERVGKNWKYLDV